MKNPKSNLSNGEQEAMKHFAKRRDIIITTADKGGAVVVMDTENYIKETNFRKKQLQNTSNRSHFTTQKKVNDTLDQFKNEKNAFQK